MARKNHKAAVGQNALPTGYTALYMRVSTDKQAEEGYSLDAQRAKLDAYCAAMGWVVGDNAVYVDAGLSGKTTARPAFQALLQDARAGKFQRVVSVALDG
jgi:site-specific DNA recombinase